MGRRPKTSPAIGRRSGHQSRACTGCKVQRRKCRYDEGGPCERCLKLGLEVSLAHDQLGMGRLRLLTGLHSASLPWTGDRKSQSSRILSIRCRLGGPDSPPTSLLLTMIDEGCVLPTCHWMFLSLSRRPLRTTQLNRRVKAWIKTVSIARLK